MWFACRASNATEGTISKEEPCREVRARYAAAAFAARNCAVQAARESERCFGTPDGFDRSSGGFDVRTNRPGPIILFQCSQSIWRALRTHFLFNIDCHHGSNVGGNLIFLEILP